MPVVVVLGFTAFILCLITTPLIRNLFLRARLVDHPDKERKFHRKAIPRIGGIAILFSYSGSFLLILLFASREIAHSIKQNELLLSMLPAVGLIFITGLLDDLITLNPRQKLFGQALASIFAISLGIKISLPQGPEWLAITISFFWLLACANALNLIDGMDGLASGVALFAAVTILLVPVVEGNLAFAIVVAPLAGSLIAFLRYNFSPASIFLGDCGSLTIGFMLGCFGLVWSHSAGSIGMAAPFITISLPLLDLALAIVRRFIRNVPIFKGDRHHIHHKILARSKATKDAIRTLYGICVVNSVLALLLYFSKSSQKWLFLSVFWVLILLGIKQLRYIEFTVMAQHFSRRALCKIVQEELYLADFESTLSKAETVDAVWNVLCTTCERFQFSNLKMKVNNHNYQQTVTTDHQPVPWQIIFPLGVKGEISLSWKSHHPENLSHMLAVLNCLQRSIAQKSFVDKRDEIKGSKTLYSETSIDGEGFSDDNLEVELDPVIIEESNRYSVSVAKRFVPTAR